ncbi:type IX secretion system membrane protein PorP/SprF [Aestuariivivens sediminis]|uniref:PorP/SprF family type IX secretion system membrane protein n=1 Tax=Aestuariivivens sediminis TaxID=2913557 RepID=UPI001F5931F1|nr:type IX secretion system membrane protein PorP/SprF [Aestuariivivens sediminis]
MNKRHKIHYLFLLLLIPFFGFTQQLPQFGQYMFNTISINPAYAGTREAMVFTLLSRNQWVGVKGAPITQTGSVDSPIPGSNLSLGLSFINDLLGYENTTYVYADVAYEIILNEFYRFSFGIKGGMSRYGLDSELLMDPSVIGDQYLERIFNKWKPNIGLGFYLRSDELFISLSSPRLVSYANDTEITYESIERASYYLAGGYLLEFNPQLKFKPTALLKYTNGSPLSLDLTANFLISETLWIGLAHRFNDAMGGYFSIRASEALSFGYSYEFNTSNLRPYSSGSHEIFMSYQIKLPKPRCNCPNVF